MTESPRRGNEEKTTFRRQAYGFFRHGPYRGYDVYPPAFEALPNPDSMPKAEYPLVSRIVYRLLDGPILRRNK